MRDLVAVPWALALLVMGAGCDNSTSVPQPAAAVVDAATEPDVTSDSAWDLGVAEVETAAGSSIDTGSTGSCGSGLSFQIVAAAGVDPGAFCTYGCNAIARITFTSGSFQVTADDIAPPNCVPLCDTCGETPPCHSCAGINPLSSAGITYDWDGSYWTSGACGGQAYRGPRVCAPAGHYTGEFCALRGTTLSGRCTPSQGGPSQDVSCHTVELDLPSTATIAVELDP